MANDKKPMYPPPGLTFDGFCKCGCGGKTRIAEQSHTQKGWFKGYPIAYLPQHSKRGKPGRNPRRKETVMENGYVKRYWPGHHLANGAGYVLEHRRIWEEANGRRLLKTEHVHHIDGNRANNTPSNLVALTNSDHHKEHGYENGVRLKAWVAANPQEHRKRLSAAMVIWWNKRKLLHKMPTEE